MVLEGGGPAARSLQGLRATGTEATLCSDCAVQSCSGDLRRAPASGLNPAGASSFSGRIRPSDRDACSGRGAPGQPGLRCSCSGRRCRCRPWLHRTTRAIGRLRNFDLSPFFGASIKTPRIRLQTITGLRLKAGRTTERTTRLSSVDSCGVWLASSATSVTAAVRDEPEQRSSPPITSRFRSLWFRVPGRPTPAVPSSGVSRSRRRLPCCARKPRVPPRATGNVDLELETHPVAEGDRRITSPFLGRLSSGVCRSGLSGGRGARVFPAAGTSREVNLALVCYGVPCRCVVDS